MAEVTPGEPAKATAKLAAKRAVLIMEILLFIRILPKRARNALLPALPVPDVTALHAMVAGNRRAQ